MKNVPLSEITFGPDFKSRSNSCRSELLEKLRSATHQKITLEARGRRYDLVVHNPELLGLMRPEYNAAELERLELFLSKVVIMTPNEKGLIQASDRLNSAGADPTHYDAVWIRDGAWAAMADPTLSLKPLLDSISTPEQLDRMRRIIREPALYSRPGGRMNAVHVRFDAHSDGFNDVMLNGAPQSWNHKQNDALGLLLDLALRRMIKGRGPDLSSANWQALSLLPAYFESIRYYECEDAGPWEEIERVNTSSVALVTSALERYDELLAAGETRLRADRWRLSALIANGYDRINTQIAAGGESPFYPANSPKFRKADAALLSVIFPARLRNLTMKTKTAVLDCVDPLIGEIGIKRYEGDSYQSGNFWFKQDGLAAAIDDDEENTSRSESEFLGRQKQFTSGTEAQWFFDSWYSIAVGELYKRTGDPDLKMRQYQFFNRALAQITAGPDSELNRLGADGDPVPAHSTPESYNVVYGEGERFYVPSPITPLNWARASLKLAFENLRITV